MFRISMVMVLTLLALASIAVEAECNAEEVGYIAVFDVKPGSEQAFEAAITRVAETVMRVESGVILYAPYKGVGGKYYMMERYVDSATRKSHASTEEVRSLFPAITSTLAGPADIRPISAVCP